MYFSVCVLRPFHTRDVYFSLPVCVLGPFYTRDESHIVMPCSDRASPGPCRRSRPETSQVNEKIRTRDTSPFHLRNHDRFRLAGSAASTVRMYSRRDSIAEAAMKWADSPVFVAASTAKVLPEADILSRRSYGHRRLGNEARRLQNNPFTSSMEWLMKGLPVALFSGP